MVTIKYLGGDKTTKELKLETIKDDIFIGLVQGGLVEEFIKEFQEEMWKRKDSACFFWLILCQCDIGEKVQSLSREFGERMSFHFVGRIEEIGWDKGINEDVNSFIKRSGKIKSLFKLGTCECDFKFVEKILARMIFLQS